MNVIKALKNCARPKRSIKRAKKTNKNKSKHVVYVTWKNDKHEIGTLIKGRYYVESELETENGWVGWDIAKKQPCILRIRNGCAVFNAEKSIDTLCESQISNLKENGNKEQCEENPTDINNGKTVKREENEMEMDTFVDSPKPIANANVPDDSDSLNLEPATGPLEIKENISNSFNWDITEGGKNISPISHSPADSVPKMEVTPFGSSELNEPELNKSELWYVTKGELNITPISANETTNEAIRDSMIPNIENSATHDIPLFVPCLLPNCPDKTIFAGCKGEIESETATTTEDPNNPSRKKYVLLNPNATPRYEVTDSVRDNTRSVIISDVPSWYAINIGKFATIQIGDYLEERYFVLRNITFTHLSSVWLCWDTEDVLYVVLKLSETTVISVLLIESEVQTIAALRDYDPTNSRRENVINIYNNFQLRLSKTAQPCIVLEAMEYNLSLYTSCWTKYILPLDLVKEITRQILEGLDYIHHTGIVHADMKPDNILVTDCKLNNSEHCPEGKTNCTKMHVKIADFANSCAGMLTGTIQTRAYRCIESILGCDCKKPADIWSVACIVFEMTVGDYLFDATNDDGLTPEQEHLIRIIELLGTIPHRIIFRGKHSRKFFDPYGKLKTEAELHPRGLVELLLLYNCLTQENADKLTAFLKPMLEYEPRKRSTAAGCLNHPWLQFE